MTLLEEVKLDLRKSNNKLDESIQEDIDFVLEYLRSVGVAPDASDPLVKRAVKNYMRYLHDFNGEGDRWKAAFDELLKTMCLSSERRIDCEE